MKRTFMKIEPYLNNKIILKLDENIKNWVRSKDSDLGYDYYNINNSAERNKSIYNKEMEGIKFLLYFETHAQVNKNKYTKKDYVLAKKFLEMRARLWDELRRKGAQYSSEKMILLAKLERVVYDKNKRSIVELGRINDELGIIKENADIVFPEYTRISKMIEKDQELRRAELQEISDSEKKKLELYLQKVKAVREAKEAEKASSGYKKEKRIRARIPIELVVR